MQLAFFDGMGWAPRRKCSSPFRARSRRATLQRHLQSLVGEQKQDLHRERFPLTPEGLFDQIWEAVLVRDDLEQSLQDWRAMRLEAVAQDAQAAAADGDDADAEAEDTSHELQSSEQPQPDNFVRPLTRLPKGHLVALAHAGSNLGAFRRALRRVLSPRRAGENPRRGCCRRSRA